MHLLGFLSFSAYVRSGCLEVGNQDCFVVVAIVGLFVLFLFSLLLKA